MLGESIRRRQKLERGAERERAPVDLAWSRWLGAGLLAIVLSFGTGYVVAVGLLFPAPDDVSEDATPAPDLIGLELTAAQAQIDTLGLVAGPVTWVPHPDQAAGSVIAQDPLPRQRLRPGAEVRLAVSSGRAQMTVPDLVGLPFETAAQLARRLGFEVNRLEEVGPAAAGTVARVEPMPGTERVLPAAITLVVSLGPPAPVFPDSALVPSDSTDLLGVPADTGSVRSRR